MTREQRKRMKKERRNKNKNKKTFSSRDRTIFSTHTLDNFVEVTESVKSTFNNGSFRRLTGKEIDTNDYDEYLLGGIRSFYKDLFFKSMFSSLTECKNMELTMKEGNQDYVCQGKETGLVHLVRWDKVRDCFLVWKHVPKDSFQNLCIKNGGSLYSFNSGQGFESIVNKQITV